MPLPNRPIFRDFVDSLDGNTSVWRAQRLTRPAAQSTGFAVLDAQLPGGGWQTGVIVELMPDHSGIGEMSVLMPTLARLTRGKLQVALIAPPHIPFAPALAKQGVDLERLLLLRPQKAADILWSCEQTLRCPAFGAVLAWPQALKDRDLRRLQLAAEAGGNLGFLYRLPAAARLPSPAALRLRLQTNEQRQLRLDILKCRGGRSGVSVQLTPGRPLSALLPAGARAANG